MLVPDMCKLEAVNGYVYYISMVLHTERERERNVETKVQIKNRKSLINPKSKYKTKTEQIVKSERPSVKKSQDAKYHNFF